MNFKILITGGSGFIGSNLIDYLLTIGQNSILSIDIKEPVNQTHYRYFRCCDILDSEKLNLIVKEFSPDYIIHLAAKADLKGDNLRYYDANISGVRNLIGASNGIINLKRVIFASTMLVCKVGYMPNHDLDFLPPNFYGQSKVIGEKIVRNESPIDLDWTIVRPSSIWGPGFGKTYRMFFEYIYAGKYFNFSGKMSFKTYGYIGNVVFQIYRIMVSEHSTHQVYYLGDYEQYSIKEWSFEIATILGKDVKTIPSFLAYSLALLGDFLKLIKIEFPMSTFRYANMTTDNILPLENLIEVAPKLPYSRKEANVRTINWMKESGYLK